jgi:uncharacterized protein YuzE
MKISYDAQVGAAYIRLKEGKFEVTTYRFTDDVAINYAPDGKVVGIKIIEASKYLVKHKRPQVELENLLPVS